ncbi:MAG: type II toxin-antitoxin system VapC family toxin [Rhizobiaceae bacterium]|nr:type II toxin-antitoxin system VapC family toxin [Rhizobiaceae bacterium]MCV0407840.1 type II toxin-antitoxin system VapC family toxin [Rhizobiaceae bacterium]
MLVETSAIVAIILEEPDALELAERLDAAERPVTTIVNAFEAALSVGRVIGNRALAARLVPDFLRATGVEMIGIEAELYDNVVEAYARYGKGTGHPAALNFGDCFSYAMADRLGVPLLYKGNDFSNTDLRGT